MRTRIITLGCLLLVVTMMMAQGIKWHQYWIDSDYSGQKTVTSGNTTFSLTVSIADLAPGIHFLNYRALNSDDEWGTLSRTLFYIPERVSEDAKIAEYEYWIDDNVADRVTGKDAKDVYLLTKDVSALADGDHTFTFRAKNTDGVWGTLYTESFAIDGSIAETLIDFADTGTESVCVANWDTDGDGYLSKTEAAAVTTLGTVFRDNEEMTSFEELQYFTSLTKLDADAFRNCTKLEALTLPDGLTEIGNNAFTNCPSLQSL
ncbi:MAG: leucine-rich repeat protein, partial [Prevotella sp.]|nr:leucine-rich repeat protein [Prevotella sp.]